MTITIRLADYQNPEDAALVVELLNNYAKDPMGGAEPLSEFSRANLVKTLANVPGAFTVLAFHDDKGVGLINCFEHFSTFKCKPLINVHDVSVNAEARGLGISHKMMAKVEEVAKQRGACKLTLEVLEGNEVAKKAYLKQGFKGYELDPEMGKAMFWEKPL